jgi:release factor glutamine methyltransferase
VIAKNVTNAEVIATDKSESALKVAAENTAKYDLTDRVKLLCGDLFEPISQLDDAQFDLITCNPPYVTSDEYRDLAKNVKDYEPKSALVAGDSGLEVYHRIFEKVDDFLKPGGCLMLEIGYTQAQAVSQLAQKTGTFEEILVKKDLNKNDRLIIAKKN